jgi:hypothetical protein
MFSSEKYEQGNKNELFQITDQKLNALIEKTEATATMEEFLGGNMINHHFSAEPSRSEITDMLPSEKNEQDNQNELLRATRRKLLKLIVRQKAANVIIGQHLGGEMIKISDHHFLATPNWEEIRKMILAKNIDALAGLPNRLQEDPDILKLIKDIIVDNDPLARSILKAETYPGALNSFDMMTSRKDVEGFKVEWEEDGQAMVGIWR